MKRMIMLFVLIVTAPLYSQDSQDISNLIGKNGVDYDDRFDRPTLGIGPDAQIDDKDLALLQYLPDLKVLHLYSIKITSKGYESLKYLKNLRIFTVSAHNFNDTSMQYLSELLLLERIDLENTKITDTGLRYLKNLNNLNDLNLGKVAITDTGLQYIKHLNIKILGLYNTKITDKGLQIIQNLNLQSLYIANTNITDASIPVIKKFNNLLTLDVRGTGISNSGIDDLNEFFQKNRNNMVFLYDPPWWARLIDKFF